MAYTSLNAITKHYSGKFGNHFVFRNRCGKSILAALPKKTNRKPSEAQKFRRRRFAQAVKFAQHILLDPDMYAAYKARARDGKPPFIIALADFLNHPVVVEIDTSGYKGNPGDLIRVQATDDFKVAVVAIRITNANGEEIERGYCQPGNHAIWWEFTPSVLVPTLNGVTITAIASDVPGHTGEMTVTCSCRKSPTKFSVFPL